MSSPNSEKHPSPQVTVIMSTYNGLHYLKEAVDSVIAQTFKDWEFLIVDDGSQDGTHQALVEMSAQDPRIKVEKNERNRGTGYSYSRLLKEAQGRYLAQIGQDDRWEPNFLATVVGHLEHNPKCACVFANVRIIGSDGKPSSAQSPFLFHWLKFQSREELVLTFIKYNFVCGGASLFRTADISNWQTLGENDQLQDWNTWQHLILKGEFHSIDQILHNYRIHESNLSLGSVNPNLVQLELSQTRLQMLLSNEFWSFVLSRENPENFLKGVIKSLLEILNPSRPDHWFSILYAIREHQHLFSDSSAIHEILGFLYWQAGAFSKARRYLGGANMLALERNLPSSVFGHFKWRWLICWARPDLTLILSRWSRYRKFGRIVIARVWMHGDVNRLKSLFPFLVKDTKSATSDRLLEVAVYNGYVGPVRASWKLLRSLARV